MPRAAKFRFLRDSHQALTRNRLAAGLLSFDVEHSIPNDQPERCRILKTRLVSDEKLGLTAILTKGRRKIAYTIREDPRLTRSRQARTVRFTSPAAATG